MAPPGPLVCWRTLGEWEAACGCPAARSWLYAPDRCEGLRGCGSSALAMCFSYPYEFQIQPPAALLRSPIRTARGVGSTLPAFTEQTALRPRTLLLKLSKKTISQHLLSILHLFFTPWLHFLSLPACELWETAKKSMALVLMFWSEIPKCVRKKNKRLWGGRCQV